MMLFLIFSRLLKHIQVIGLAVYVMYMFSKGIGMIASGSVLGLCSQYYVYMFWFLYFNALCCILLAVTLEVFCSHDKFKK